ncbi:putative toxin-antitoxin system toxin component, PIN family [Ramlibacter sp. MAH-25]|uniref:Putative toxin-antitoxin system toxin component, PIN family n=1 Tax=Ramlibacter pinisoli TaxID=2682844 RepID=A0A6N8IXE9_9BURK|nr:MULTISPECIES: putative toxin-antitoxin system toxin component, PIN family [Ramlibacter]MBA2965670.1 putative toxin-antitoxin system toxin component, PIN family [Ramlibacter sp. CGMCC 1.13660]MVQ30636.1 putative toxin-antitoxin system toxin component, PIN family [Ramlibacter pinisoli]
MPQPLVLDTNVVLDAFVFDDLAVRPLLPALDAGLVRWLATAAMRDELARVLDYPKLQPRLARRGLAAADVLARFDRHATVVGAPAKAAVTCGDPDDQKFIDLAVASAALLLSKDAEVLALRRRLAGLAVTARAPLPTEPLVP